MKYHGEQAVVFQHKVSHNIFLVLTFTQVISPVVQVQYLVTDMLVCYVK